MLPQCWSLSSATAAGPVDAPGTSGAGVPGGSQPHQGSVQAAGSGLVSHGAEAHVLDLVRDRDFHTGYPGLHMTHLWFRTLGGGYPHSP